MDLGIAGRVALVTAAFGRGLGRASADALAREGAKVVICARGADTLAAAERALAEHTEVLAIPADVTDPEAPAALVARTIERFGRLDVLVANAGGPPPGRSLEVGDADIEAAINANLLTSVRLVRESVPHMRAGGWGRICLITSSSIKQPIPTLALSNTARTGLWAWAKTAAADLYADGITLNTACPGYHATERFRELHTQAPATTFRPRTPGPVGDPEDFGKVVAFLCSQPAAFITGAAVLVDGGAYAGLS